MPQKKIKDGDVFGEWVVLKAYSSKNKYGSWQSLCKCSCGVVKEVSNSSLILGRSKSCGHDMVKHLRERVYAKSDKKLIGKTFGELTVLKRVNHEGNARYLCRCSCGKELELIGSALLAGQQKTCGHVHKKGYKKFSEIKDLGTKDLESKRVEGTSLYAISVKKPRTNTSGYKGVSYVPRRKKYRAYIGLRGKQKHLGMFDTAEEAYQVRLNAEEKYYKPILDRHKDKFEK